MIPSAFENVKRLPDDQLARMVQSAKQGDMTAIEALNLTSATPILAEMMRRNRIRETLQKNMMEGAPDPQTVLDKQLAKAQVSQGVGGLEIPGMMEEQAYADGGIVAFSGGGQPEAGFIEEPPIEGTRQTLYKPEYYDAPPVAGGARGISSVAPQSADEFKELSPEEYAKLSRLARLQYDKRLLKRDYEKARSEVEKPDPYTEDEIRDMVKKNIELSQGISAPHLKRMQELIAQAKPDEAKIRKDAMDRAINTGLLSMIGARKIPGRGGLSSLVSNVGDALRTGAADYEKGVGGIDKLKQKYTEAELKFVEAQNAAARGDYDLARRLVDSAVRDRQTQSNMSKAEMRTLQRIYDSDMKGLTQEYVKGEDLERARIAAEAKVRAAQIGADSRTEAARIRALGAGSGGNLRPNDIARQVSSFYKNRPDLIDKATSLYPGDDVAQEQYLRGQAIVVLGGSGKDAPRAAATPPGTIVLDSSGKFAPK